ncbi:uncharacterized protein LOC107759989 [Nicotiana tabacum]|uniref:uncharacterized protein LOC107759989 n=1 Tax=Nicotiana tabacum TaxID=4097 RepID=UPI003F4EDAE2
MADMQKGFAAALNEVLPNAEFRMCARHIWSNWHKKWKGEERRKQFWRCSKSSYEVKFKEELEKMDKLGKDICRDLLYYPKKSWVRAYFEVHSKCDVVENNMCETFNSWILASRHKSIITMLEEIRRKIMTRQVDMLKFADTWISDISPMARLLLEDSKDLARKCTVLWNADVGFEIGEGLHKHVVNLTDKVCTCRAWQLRGIPCQHAVLAYYHINEEPEQAVEHWYKRDTFLKAYKYFIQPMTNMKMWSETNNPMIEPPKPKPMPGRPQRNRRKGKDEPKKKYGKLSKCGVKMTCSKCHQQGHNKRYCKAENWMHSQQGSQSSQGASQPDAAGSSSQPTNSMCFDTTRVRRVNEARSSSQPTPSSTDSSRPSRRGLGSQLPPKGKKTTSQKRGRGASQEDAEKGAQKRSKNVGFGIYTAASGTQILKPETSSQRVMVSGSTYKSAAPTRIDLGFKARGLRWKGQDAVTTSQLQQMKANFSKK